MDSLERQELSQLTNISTQIGAGNIANDQVTVSSASIPIVAARTTRRSVLIKNTHATDTLYIGIGTVTSGHGFPLPAGASVPIYTTAAINGVRGGSNDIIAAYIEEYT